MYFAAFLMLSVLSIITALGVFSVKFQDNLMQRIGLILMCMGSLSLAWRMWEVMVLSRSAVTFLLGVTLFAFGTCLKTWHWRHETENRVNAISRSHR